jgi:hypothetical protein
LRTVCKFLTIYLVTSHSTLCLDLICNGRHPLSLLAANGPKKCPSRIQLRIVVKAAAKTFRIAAVNSDREHVRQLPSSTPRTGSLAFIPPEESGPQRTFCVRRDEGMQRTACRDAAVR